MGMASDALTRMIRYRGCMFFLMRSVFCCLLFGMPGMISAAAAATELQALVDRDPAAAIEVLDRKIAAGAAGRELADYAELYRLRAQARRTMGAYPEASADAERFRELAELDGEPLLMSRAFMMVGTIHAEQGELASALEQFHEARRMLEGTVHLVELARIHNALGVAHQFLEDFQRAADYYRSGLEIIRNLDRDRLTLSLKSNLALTVAALEGPAASVGPLLRVLELSRELGDEASIMSTLANLCDNLVQSGDLARAEPHCAEALELLRQAGMKRHLAGVLMVTGDLNRQTGAVEQAMAYYEEALEMARGRIPTVERPLLEKLARLHEERGEHDIATAWWRELLAFKSERLEQDRQAAIEELEIQYAVEQREGEIELLRLQTELDASRLAQRNIWLMVLSIGLVLSLLVALAILRNYRARIILQRELAERNRALREALEQVSRLATTDTLTGLLNRRALIEQAGKEMARAEQDGRRLSLVMADADGFKEINDRFGHRVGDEVLCALAGILRQGVRSDDLVCRWGGEEVLIVLTRTEPNQAVEVVERLRESVAGQTIHTSIDGLTLTMTFGLAPLESDLDKAIAAADEALYAGKRAGRNRVTLAEAGPRDC